MFVDPDLLRSGAEFSRSAGTTAQEGADKLLSTQLAAKIFGDFAEADDFHRALARTQEAAATAMQGHQARLHALTEKVHTAASTFTAEDEQQAAALQKARLHFS
ncbi:DUF2563 family protein [Mycobacterium hubeiense]|uniref:DUF2563 family protein n=1 Tax=Mycobacterium hubeiense TaxID=1867256 RepID=UPI000C7EEEDA|nr:DUF2563 family protein [Mycobacterium sp. QGD 101]